MKHHVFRGWPSPGPGGNMKKLLLILLIGVVAVSLTYAGSFEYIGSKKCKMCHKSKKRGEVYQKWEKGPHAKAFESLKKKGKDKDPACLECHVTAFNKGGYKVGDANAAKFEGVGCESCHGPGSKYKKNSVMKDKKKAMENGLIVPSEDVCKKCHNKKSPTFKGFDYKKYKEKINHNYRK